MAKKLLYLEDLYDFYSNKYKCSTHFSAEKTGHQLFVQVPAEFEIDKNSDYEDNSLLFCKVKLMHSGENRNHSNVTDEALIKASKTLAYKPVLANFMEYEDEETGETLKDFTSHDMELNDDGTVNYIEKQIGCFTSDEPFFEIEEETGHNFLYGYCAIPKEYTDATSIIERKGGTKISVELAVNEMSFNTNTKVLELTDVIIMGATCLGKDPNTLQDVGEGMLNARLDIADFSAKNNSLFNDYEFKLIELQERLDKLESSCFNNTDNSKKGGDAGNMNKFEELLKKYNKTTEDVTFEYAELSDEELEAKFEEEFGDEVTTSDDLEDNSDDENGDDDATVIEDENGDDGGEDSEDPDDGEGESQAFENMTRTFEISHDDIRYALYNLLGEFEEIDNEWYYITSVFDTYFVYESWDSGKIYGQKYSKDNDNVAFDGERYSLHKEYLTDSELAEINSMRSEYSALKEFKENIEKNELHSKREEIINSEKYSVLAEKDEEGNFVNNDFAKLVSEMDNYSLADLETKVKVMHSDYVISHTAAFAVKEEKQKKKVLFMANSNSEKESKKKAPYGGIFEKYNK